MPFKCVFDTKAQVVRLKIKLRKENEEFEGKMYLYGTFLLYNEMSKKSLVETI